MMTRIIFSLALVLALLGLSAGQSFAHDDESQPDSTALTERTTTNKPTRLPAREQFKTELKELRVKAQELKGVRETQRTEAAPKQLAEWQTFGKRMLEVRIKTLTVHQRYLDQVKCSTGAKSIISQSITTTTNQLRAKVTELEAATTAEEVRALVKSAIEDTRVYSVWMPSTRLLCISSRIIELIDGRLAETIDQLEPGDEATKLRETLTKAKAEAKAAFDQARELVRNPGASKADLDAARAKVRAARSHLQTTRQLLGEIRSSLAKLSEASLNESRRNPQYSPTNDTESLTPPASSQTYP